MITLHINTDTEIDDLLYQPRFSDDERGGKVELRGDELRQLYRALRPAEG